MTPEQEARLERVEFLLAALVRSDRLMMHKTLQFDEGRNIQFGIATGTQIGTAPTQKIGFYGGTPQIQVQLPNPSTTSVTTTVNTLYTTFITNGLFSV